MTAKKDAWPNVEGTRSEYVILWFHPFGDCNKKFTDEAKARRFAKTEAVAEWNPILMHRITVVSEEILPLDAARDGGAA